MYDERNGYPDQSEPQNVAPQGIFKFRDTAHHRKTLVSKIIHRIVCSLLSSRLSILHLIYMFYCFLPSFEDIYLPVKNNLHENGLRELGFHPFFKGGKKIIMTSEAKNQSNGQPIRTPQPRPALTLINSPRVISYENYECFIGVSTNVADLKTFIGLHATQMHPVLLIGERGLRQEQIARVLHQAGANWAEPFFAVNAHGLSS